MAAAAQTLKHVSPELGGKNPQVILADADLHAAVASASWAARFNQSECCQAARWYSIGLRWVTARRGCQRNMPAPCA